MPWRRPRKRVERPINVSRAIEESLEEAAAGEEEDESAELAELNGASVLEAATGEPDIEARAPSPFAEQLARVELGTEPTITPVRSAVRPEDDVDLAVDAARGLRLRNPVLTASGTFGQGVEYAELIDVSRLGAFVNKGTTVHARPGNPQYRIAETPSGILNSIGLENPGAAEVARKYGKAWVSLGVPVIVNVGGGMLFGCDPGLAAEVTAAVKQETDLPIIVKLTPNAPDVVAVARAVEAAGADGLTAINTVLGMRIDVKRRRPILGTGS